ncbi:unnamed protein product [Linum tenue]|uniref:Uncharacterized protein n=1 Tax=Linum tenue TaxID=586396 RepID=A0AAV0RCE7_9ROSI|nr:unnamed protein product [Linum tenue]
MGCETSLRCLLWSYGEWGNILLPSMGSREERSSVFGHVYPVGFHLHSDMFCLIVRLHQPWKCFGWSAIDWRAL